MDKKGLAFSIITVLLLGMLVTGRTFAYLQWLFGFGDKTNVNVMVNLEDNITMHIESDSTVIGGLRPTKNCNKTGNKLILK